MKEGTTVVNTEEYIRLRKFKEHTIKKGTFHVHYNSYFGDAQYKIVSTSESIKKIHSINLGLNRDIKKLEANIVELKDPKISDIKKKSIFQLIKWRFSKSNK